MDLSGKAVLVVYAHPDDESLGNGGTLAALTRAGARVQLVTATRGDVGGISNSELATRETLPEVRERELRCACEALGIEPPIVLSYRDSGMAGSPENENPDALIQAPLEQVASKIAEVARELRPQVVITFDPSGGYGHPDHIWIHRATVLAHEQAPELEGTTLLYSVFPRIAVRALLQRLEDEGIDTSAFEGMALEHAGVPEDEINLTVNVSSAFDAKYEAIRCHATQVGLDHPWLKLPEIEARDLLSYEYYVQASPPPTGNCRGTVEILFEQ